MSNKFIKLIGIIIILSGAIFLIRKEIKSNNFNENKILAKVYKSPTCGCCLDHASYLRGEKFDVETIVENDITSIKEKYKIPYNMQSCHTTEIEGYFVEGHVPIEAINKLLTEKPDIDGISLPDMPAGSPGMPGIKREEFIIYSLKDGESTEFMRL